MLHQRTFAWWTIMKRKSSDQDSRLKWVCISSFGL